MRHVHVLQVLGAQLQSLCEKRSFVAQLKTDLQKPQILMTAENLLALILHICICCICFFFKFRKTVSVKGESWMICKGLM
jgi:hypothetical protein